MVLARAPPEGICSREILFGFVIVVVEREEAAVDEGVLRASEKDARHKIASNGSQSDHCRLGVADCFMVV